MFKLPISDYVAKYYKEHNIQLTYRQQATICWLAVKSIDVLDLLKELLLESDDEELNKEIEETIEYEKEVYRRFMIDEPGRILYKISHGSGDIYNEQYFNTFEAALAFGRRYYKKSDEGFYIRKVYYWESSLDNYYTSGDLKYADDVLGDELDDVVGKYYFGVDGKAWCGYINGFEAPYDEDDNRRFDNAFINITCPFEEGDIVISPYYEYPLVIRETYRCYKELNGKIVDDKGKEIEYAHNAVDVVYYNEDGELSWDSITPFSLTKINIWNDNEYWKKLLKISQAVKNNENEMFLEMERRYKF